ncbi:hypothetical protein [Bosea sp. (in: a-proteobacteria)]|uniref:hypothetical protein n=1 Tax=Bosea sp. (in: a-proteobacteria) TaxID=1871050 RepID=UPI002733A202|nr:hypothetical protein [Bosea sp. (in: a-proteobacteria)]MDP3255376.1 hypothetical protein [Bosea sp. (in: a-proteobacteria)]
MTDLIDGVAVFEQREAQVRAAANAAHEPAPKTNPFSFSPRIAVGPDVTAITAPASHGPTIDSHLDPSNADILATGRTQSGFQRAPAELGLNDLVTINGDPTTVKVALRLGYLSGKAGDFKDTGLAAKEAGGAGAQDAPKSDVQPDYTGNETAFDDRSAENLFGHIVHGTPEGAQIRAMTDVIAKGEVSTDTIRAMADAARVSPQTLQADLAKVQDAFAGQAAKAFRAAGVTDPDGFVEWAERHHRGEFKDAMSQHVMDRNPKAYAKLVSKYLASGESSIPADLMEATSETGVVVRKVDGQVVLDLPGIGTMSYAAAVRQGLVKLSRG